MQDRASKLSFDSGPPLDPPANGQAIPSHLQRNLRERSRLQGLMHTMSTVTPGSVLAQKGEMGAMEKLKVWMVNEVKLWLLD